MKAIPFLQLAVLLLLWVMYVSTGAAGLNVETGLVVVGSILYLCTMLREAAHYISDGPSGPFCFMCVCEDEDSNVP